MVRFRGAMRGRYGRRDGVNARQALLAECSEPLQDACLLAYDAIGHVAGGKREDERARSWVCLGLGKGTAGVEE